MTIDSKITRESENQSLLGFKMLRFWFPVILYSGMIFTSSAIPVWDTNLNFSKYDKLIHVFEYIPFGLLLAHALVNTEIKLFNFGCIPSVLILTLFYGLTDEYHQSFVVGRAASLIDCLADVSGGLIGAWLYMNMKKMDKPQQ